MQAPSITVRFINGDPRLAPANCVVGFIHLWAVYVRGFDSRYHCQRCLKGRVSRRITTSSTPVGSDLLLDEDGTYSAVYLCGVARGPRKLRALNNVHLPLENDVGSSYERRTYNGYIVQVTNARRLEIPELPVGWRGLPEAYLRCCNFRFGVYRFGYRNAIQSARTGDQV